MGWILNRLFLGKAFDPLEKPFGNQIVPDVKEVFVARLAKSSWMEPQTIGRAVTKVRDMAQKIGYPEEVQCFCLTPALWSNSVFLSSPDFAGSRYP
jgi:predicted metalloendopeptidase